MRTYDAELFRQMKLPLEWVQHNHSYSAHKGTIRGFHFLFPPHTETKMIRVSRGEALDVFVDLRLNSETFGKWGSVILSPEKHNAVIIPKGFAHAFCTLTNHTDMIYYHDEYYNPEAEGGILWNDPEINVGWPAEKALVSERDSQLPSFSEFKKRHKGLQF